ncbi:unnamed protein product [Heterobilharzia americana]|nr:unnamed protein product [Heterobilharzia americana]
MNAEADPNLIVIQSYDKFCTQIIDKSSSAHVYSFQGDKNEWAKTETGGIFFLYKRSKVPFFAFMILNRLQLQLHCPFLLYKTPKGEIFSIWFFSASDCERIAEKLGKLVHDVGGLGLRIAPSSRSVNTLAKSSTPATSSLATTPKSPETVTKGLNQLMNFVRASNENSKLSPLQPSRFFDNNVNRSNHSEAPSIFDMLHKAEADFNSGVSTGNQMTSHSELTVNDELQRFRTACNLPVSNGNNLSSDRSRPPVANGVSNNTKNKSDTRSSHMHNHISVAELEEQLLQEHISVPEELKTVVPTDDSSPDDQGLSQASATESPTRHHQVHKDVCTDRNRRLLSDDAGYVDDVDDEEACENNRDRGLPKSFGLGQRKQRRHMRYQQDNLSDEVHSPSNRSVNRNKSTDISQKYNNTVGEETLVTPDMLTSIPSSILPAFVPEVSRDKHSEDKVFTSEVKKTVVSEYLTKDQLKETLIHLLQTDDGFVHRIHTGYVNVLERRLSRK